MSLEFQNSVLGKMNGFLYRCKADSAYTMLNLTDGLERLYGHAIEGIIGNRVRSYASLIHPDDVGHVDNIVNHGIATHTTYNIEYRLVTTKGDYLWVHETGGGIWDKDGELMYVEGAVFDIEELHQRSHQRQQFLLTAAAQTETMLESLRYLKLLALNAGIEAARVGSAGAGFAVLAREMRGLAETTETAAKSLNKSAV